jgi:hypothetical protein
MKANRIIIILTGLLISSYSIAQKSCLNTLREAKELYEQGLINEIPQLLHDCMESGFTRAQRIEAYKLIILAYLFDDDQFAAEKMMDEFLRKFPEYEVMPNDPVEFVYLLESYQTSSYYSINFTFGPTFSNQQIIEPYSQLDRKLTSFYDKIGTGFIVHFGISRNLWKDVNGSIGLSYSINNYSQSEKTVSQINDNSVDLVDLSVHESITKLDVPLTFSYRFGKGNIGYFFRLGGMISFISKANLTPVRTQPDIDPVSADIAINDYRRKYYFSAVAGAGLEYKVPRGFLVLDIRYNAGLQNMIAPGNRFSSPRYFYTDDDFSLNSVSLTLGYHFRMYKSKKNRQQ